ncbi:MAG: BatA domain-containing protein [Gemmataceae bacterium]|nr:BatA domain-containing protein [Gemmataceae bacterium]
MLDMFLNPWSMAAGAALVSVPIIIHLINRMRFKRIRWAAMEFVIKAQKRMKRKLIFQQLLLLFLRCLMVFLFGLLVGRFLGFNPLDGRETRTTAHVVVIDDSPSMGDFFRGDDGQITDALAMAKKVLLEQIAPAAAQASTAQTLDLLTLSKPTEPRSFGRINNTSIDEAKSFLNGVEPSPVRGSLVEALKKAKESLDAQPGVETSQVIHVLSDFRAADWERDADAIKTVVAELATARVKVHFVDVAHPFRKDEKQAPLHHDNVGIVELKPSKLVAARYEPLEFTLTVRNFGAAELKDIRFPVAVNGDDAKGLSVQFPSLPGNAEKSLNFSLTFDQIGTPERPLDRYSLVTARMEAQEAGGIAIDNARHAIVEVRDRLPMLVVDGKPANRDKKESDSFYLQRVFTDTIGGFRWVPGTVKDLEGDLRQYTCVLLLNVPTVPEAAAKNLEAYARDGGGVGFFLGPDVKPADYNKVLYADGTGIFPVPLPENPSAPVPDEVMIVRRFSPTKKILLREPALKQHPAVAPLYTDERGLRVKSSDELEKFFPFITINRYWPVKRLGKWRDDRTVTELFCMPNESPMGDYDKPTVDFLAKLPVDEPKYAKYKPLLDDLKTKLRTKALSTEPLYELAALFDQLLADQRSDGRPEDALLREFWGLPELGDLRTEAQRLRDLVKFGDPFYFVKQFGKGRITVITTTAGETWNDWASLPPGNACFQPVMVVLERYLSGGTAEANRSVGEKMAMDFDAARYRAGVARAFLSYDPLKPAAGGAATELKPVDLKEQVMTTNAGQHEFRFADSTKPGGYLFTFTQVKPQATGGEAPEVPEYHAAAFNVDAKVEGDLRRWSRDDILTNSPGAELHSAGDAGWVDALKNKKSDWTEAGWIFLVLLLVLIVEGALAVKLSHHTAPGTMDHAAPTVAALMNRTANPGATTPANAT